MPDSKEDQLLHRIRTHAFSRLPFNKRETTNLHLDEHVYKEGEKIGPEFQKIWPPGLASLCSPTMTLAQILVMIAVTCFTTLNQAISIASSLRVSHRFPM